MPDLVGASRQTKGLGLRGHARKQLNGKAQRKMIVQSPIEAGDGLVINSPKIVGRDERRSSVLGGVHRGNRVHRGGHPDAVVRARQSVPVPVPIRHELPDLSAFVQWRRLRDSMRAAVVSLAAWVPGHNPHTLRTEARVGS